RIDLSPGELLDVRAVGAEAIRVARLHRHLGAVLRPDRRGIREAVTGVDPAVESPGEGTGHAVRVAKAVLLIKDLAFVRLSSPAVEAADSGDAEHERLVTLLGAATQRQYANGDIESIGEGGDLAGPPIGTEVVEDLDGVARLAARRGRVRILEGVGDPEPSA